MTPLSPSTSRKITPFLSLIWLGPPSVSLTLAPRKFEGLLLLIRLTFPILFLLVLTLMFLPVLRPFLLLPPLPAPLLPPPPLLLPTRLLLPLTLRPPLRLLPLLPLLPLPLKEALVPHPMPVHSLPPVLPLLSLLMLFLLPLLSSLLILPPSPLPHRLLCRVPIPVPLPPLLLFQPSLLSLHLLYEALFLILLLEILFPFHFLLRRNLLWQVTQIPPLFHYFLW